MGTLGQALVRALARGYMAFRECVVADRRAELNEEAVADLNTCLEQLTDRAADLELKIEKAGQRAAHHRRLMERERVPGGRRRELERARLHLTDRRRLQGVLERTLRSMHVLRQQIEVVVTTHVDSMVVDAMRQYSATAARMGLPDRTREVERLADELQDRSDEALQLQEALVGVASSGGYCREADEDDFMAELDALLGAAAVTPPAVQEQLQPAEASPPPPEEDEAAAAVVVVALAAGGELRQRGVSAAAERESVVAVVAA